MWETQEVVKDSGFSSTHTLPKDKRRRPTDRGRGEEAKDKLQVYAKQAAGAGAGENPACPPISMPARQKGGAER